jgi:uncharacterized SAM-binding protein YcdF (DUF218 family)
MSPPEYAAGAALRSRPRRARTRRRIIWLLAFAFLVAALVTAFREVGCWLVVEDPLQHADAIVVLSGRMPLRAIEAAQLYRQGYAPEMWLTHPGGMREEMARLGLEYTDEDTYNAEVLEKLGVPPDAIRVLPGDIADTEDEVREIAGSLRRSGKTRVIIVTSPPHTRRVRTLWRKLVGKSPQAIIRYSRSDPFDAAHWWRHTRDSLDVLRETFGLLNVWAGLHVRPGLN